MRVEKFETNNVAETGDIIEINTTDDTNISFMVVVDYLNNGETRLVSLDGYVQGVISAIESITMEKYNRGEYSVIMKRDNVLITKDDEEED